MTIANAPQLADSTADFISSAQTTANTAIANLNLVAAGWTAVAFNAIANPGTGNYVQFADSEATIKAALEAFDAALTAIPVPSSLPSAPNLSEYTTQVWNETFWTNLKSGISAFLGNITTGDDVDSVVTKLTSETSKLQVALYAADLERKQQALRDAGSFANSATGAKGFSYPNSMTTALKLDAQQKYMFDLSQASRDLVKYIFEWAKSNYQFSIQQGVNAHQADIDFNIRYADTLLRSFDAQFRNILDKYRTTVAGELSKAEFKVKEYAQRLDVVRTNAGIVGEQDRIKASNYSADIQQHATNVRLAVETAATNARNEIDAAIAGVNAAATMVASANQVAVGVLAG